MANYMNIQAAIDAGVTNMTVVRNNVANDDSTDTIATDITWFYYNSVQVTNLYVSGNTWIGFGASAEHLKVNRRDAKVYYEYTEAGVIGLTRYFKLRWCGYSAYSSTADSYKHEYDVFLLDDGRIYLNWYDVPTSSFNGTNALVCGSATTSFVAAAGTAGEWIFTPSNAANGTGWSVETGRPDISVDYKPSGAAVYATTGFQSITDCQTDTAIISWNEDKPTGTSVTVSYALTASTPSAEGFTAVTNGAAITALNGADFSGKTLYIKVALATTDGEVTPSFFNLSMTAEDVMVQNFVSTRQTGVYKVYCDIADRLRGITVMNKKTSLLRFASGEKVPGFSTHMFIAGQDMMDSFGYMYESLSRAGSNKHLTLSPLSVTEADSIDLADNLSDTEVSETTTIINLFGALTATETATVTLI